MKKALILGEYRVHRLLPGLLKRGFDEVVVYSATGYGEAEGVSAIRPLELDWDVNAIIGVLEKEQPDVAISNPIPHGQEQFPIMYGDAATKWDGRFIAHPAEFAEVGCDKVVLHETAVARGWPVPDGVVCTNATDVEDAVRRLSFPVVVKEAQSQADIGRSYVSSPGDLDALLTGGLTFPAIVQRFEHGAEFGIELMSLDGAHLHWPIVSMGPLDSSLNPSFRPRVAPAVLPARAHEELARVVHDIQGHFTPFGPWQIDFAVVGDSLRILEINPRLSGLADMGAVGTGTDAHDVLGALAAGEPLPTVAPLQVTIDLPLKKVSGPIPEPPPDSSMVRFIREPTNRFCNTDRMQLIATVTELVAAKAWVKQLDDTDLLRCPTQSVDERLDQGFATFDEQEDWPCVF